MMDRYTFVAEERNARSILGFITYTKVIQHEIKDIKTIPDAEIGLNHCLVVANLQIAEVEKEEENEYTKIMICRLEDEKTRRAYQMDTDKRKSRSNNNGI